MAKHLGKPIWTWNPYPAQCTSACIAWQMSSQITPRSCWLRSNPYLLNTGVPHAWAFQACLPRAQHCDSSQAGAIFERPETFWWKIIHKKSWQFHLERSLRFGSYLLSGNYSCHCQLPADTCCFHRQRLLLGIQFLYQEMHSPLQFTRLSCVPAMSFTSQTCTHLTTKNHGFLYHAALQFMTVLSGKWSALRLKTPVFWPENGNWWWLLSWCGITICNIEALFASHLHNLKSPLWPFFYSSQI